MLVCQAHPAFTENCTGTLLLLSKIALLVPLFYWETLLQCRFDGPIVVLSFGRLRQDCCKFRASLGYRVRLPRKGNKEEKGISLAHTFIVQSAVLVTSVSCECALNPGLFLFSCVKQLWTCTVWARPSLFSDLLTVPCMQRMLWQQREKIVTAQAIIVHSNKYLEKVCVALIKKLSQTPKKRG